MHILVRFLVASFLANNALGQVPRAESADCIRINKLVLVSNGLPDADGKRIIRLFERKTYPQAEISERIQGAFRDLGYFKAVVDEPKFSLLTQTEERRGENVTVKVKAGSQYHIGEIRIENATVFPSARLRSLFSLHSGELFNATKFAEGLDNIRSLYATQGYVDLVPMPEAIFDESHHRIDLVVAVDENKPYNFGHLYLEGIEPHAGAGRALFNSWKPLDGKRYNSLELQHWLRTNHAAWKVDLDAMRTDEDPNSLAVNVTLTQWPDRKNW
jgi:Surface antigen variable number repeat